MGNMKLTPEELDELHRLDAALHAYEWHETVDANGNRRFHAPPRAVMLDHNTLHRYRKQATAVEVQMKALRATNKRLKAAGLKDGPSAS